MSPAVIEPFFRIDERGHQMMVLAATFEVTEPRSSATFPTLAEADRYADKLRRHGVTPKVLAHVVDAIDVTAAVRADFGDSTNRKALADYRASWCNRTDPALPPRHEWSGS